MDSVIKNDTCIYSGGMAEWLKAAVLKTVVPRGTVGSNPTPSATSQALKEYLAEDLMQGQP